ncbi:MAG: DNA (cytosine-5-)-methyltransferase [Gemmatimonadetes bacterium]|nr:DNA (cytosine-5-)-methyltransferase [Gemmatimonadota bacterium]
MHRISATACKLLAETTYHPGALKRRAKNRGKASIALELLDTLRRRWHDSVVVAGPSYGCNARFLAGLGKRNLDFAVEVRPSTQLSRAGNGVAHRSRAAASDFLDKSKWTKIDLFQPGATGPMPYKAATLADIQLPGDRNGRLFAAQTGGIPGIHRGTIFGISSDLNAKIRDLLRVVGWARWIRPRTRKQERRLLTAEAVPDDFKTRTERTSVAVRSNITVARQQDNRAIWREEQPSRPSTGFRRVLASSSPVLNVVELFAGAGGMGLGFLLAERGRRRYRIIFSGEVNPIYVETLRMNHDVFSVQRRSDRSNCVPEHVEPIDLRTDEALSRARRAARLSDGVHILIGGPPCQGFSNANRNSWHYANPHNRLIGVFLQYVDKLRPPVFLLENVQGMLWTPRGGRSSAPVTVVDHLARRITAAGYELFPKLLDSVWYGVPQYRSRFFLLGLRRDLGYRADDFGEWGPFPLPTHGPGCSRPFVTVRDAIRDLPAVRNGARAEEQQYCEPDAADLRANPFLRLMRGSALGSGVVFDHVTSCHADYVIERYRRIPQGGNWRDIAETLTNYAQVERTHSNIYRRLTWTDPSITIGHYRKSMLVHPSQHRGLSLREASRLQSFPDWFRFAGSSSGRNGGLVHKQQQLANAVCPLVTMALANFILDL